MDRARAWGLSDPSSGNDMLIAAIAIANNVTLVTHNTGEYGRISGLKIEDWESP
jgi:tRNA(fMet)-specific endonuclease VapC